MSKSVEDTKYRIAAPADQGLTRIYSGGDVAGAVVVGGRCRVLAYRSSPLGMMQIAGWFATREKATAAVLRRAS